MSDRYIHLHDADGNNIGMVDREWADKNFSPERVSFSIRGTADGLRIRDDKKLGVIKGGK
jgi:hypothetical protein